MSTVLLYVVDPFLRLGLNQKSNNKHEDGHTINNNEIPSAKVPD